MSDSMTLLRCARGLRLAKLIRPDGIVTYDSTRTYDAWTVPVFMLTDIQELLSKIIQQPRLCIVRGQIIGSDKAKNIRRLLYRDPKTGDEATLAEVSRQWVALDIEGIKRPPQINADNLHACATDAMRHLPHAFRGAACLIQATAGHGIKPDHRLRLWFWLSRPTTGAELKRWLKGCPADPSVFRAAQVIYTAAPVFEGCMDHLPKRLAMLNGSEVVEVPSSEKLAPPAPKPDRPITGPSEPGANAYAWAALRNAVAKVANASVDRRHPTCLAQSMRLSHFVSTGMISVSDVTSAMGQALTQAGKTKEEGEAIAAWALSHASGSAT